MKTRLTKLLNSASSRNGRFARDESGAIALVMAMLAVPFFLAAGVALDTFRASSAQADVQASLDAAALAAAAASPNTPNATRKRMAEEAFKANIAGGMANKLNGTADISFDGESVTVSYSGTLPTTLMTLGGFDTMNVAATSTARMRLPQKAEIALVLDYSESMLEVSAGKRKYITMKDAAIDMVNGLTEDGANEDVHFALVPFSHNVYTTLPSAMVVDAPGASWTGCTYDRQYPYNTTSAAPGGADASKWGQPVPTNFGSYGAMASYHCDGRNHNGNGYLANRLVTRELDDDHSATISQLRAMKPYGYTNISLGLEFGWHMLEPGAPYAARSFSDKKNKKFVVLLTDGQQTAPAFGSGNSRNAVQGERNLETLCDNIKQTDITVITIAFALKHGATRARLRNCSTDPDKNFFEAEDSNDLTRAFEEIQNQIASAIYLSK